MKFDPEIQKEIKFTALGCAVCTAVVVLVFAIIGYFDLSVLWGALIGYALSVGNFVLMSYGVVKALETGDEAIAKTKMHTSYVWRTIVMLAIMALSIAVEAIHWVPVVASVFYPRIIVTVRNLYRKFKTRNDPPPRYDPVPDDEDEKPDEFESFVSGFAKGKIPSGEGKPRVSGDDGENKENNNEKNEK